MGRLSFMLTFKWQFLVFISPDSQIQLASGASRQLGGTESGYTYLHWNQCFLRNICIMAVKNITSEISLIFIPKDTFRDISLNVTKC